MTVREPVPAGGSAGAPDPDGSSPRGPDELAHPRRRRAGRRWTRWIRRVLAVVVALGLLGIAAFGVLLAVTPSAGNAQRLVQAQARAHHAAYPGPPVPPRFAVSLVATEDHRFYSEPGIDPLAIGRVALARVTGGGDQGGATLYQQLAKLLYTSASAGTTAKAEQLAIAVKLYLTYSKTQILQMYADVAYFGHGYYGLAIASCGYFGKRPAQLSWAQAALLAGLVLAPSADNPVASPGRARAREAHVLGRLVATHTLSPAEASAALAEPMPHVAGHAQAGCMSS